MTGRVIFVLRSYPPYVSATGGLVRNVVEALRPSVDVRVLAWRDGSPSSVHTGGYVPAYVTWLDDPAQARPRQALDRARQRLSPSSMTARRRAVLHVALERLEVSRGDVVVACTSAEIRALSRMRTPVFRYRVLFAERLIRPSRQVARGPLGYLAERWTRRAERSALLKAERVYALPTATDHIRRFHPEVRQRMVPVEHPMVRDLTTFSGQGSDQLTFVYAGGLDLTDRHPGPAVTALSIVAESLPIEAHFYTYGNCEHYLRNPAFARFLRLRGPVSPDVAERALQAATFIITIGNRDRGLTPSKIFDAISTGRPIVHFSCIDDDPYENYLERYRLGLFIPHTASARQAAEMIAALVPTWATDAVAWSDIAEGFAECRPEALAQILMST